MNLLSKSSLLSCVALLAVMIFSGCASSDTPQFSDNPNPQGISATGTGVATTNGTVLETLTTSNEVESIPEGAARFEPGETVMVATSTGSDAYPGPISGAGQPYLIADNGMITLPYVGGVLAVGKTPGELQEEITTQYVPKYFVRLTVTVTAPQRVYYVGGEVGHPGPQVYIGETTVTKAIQTAGDLSQFASHRVWLNRKDGTRIRVNYDKALRDSTQDPQVFPGDQIQVPRRYL
jgi:polysaccharide biosynthesis/export protein